MSTVKNIQSKPNWISDLSFDQWPRIVQVAFIKDEIAFILDDERIIYTTWMEWKVEESKICPRGQLQNQWYPRILDDVDEIIGVKNILFGKEFFL